MTKFIQVKFSELFLKGKNKSEFLNALSKNIKQALEGIEYKLITHHDHFQIHHANKEDELIIINILKFVPGIHSLRTAFLVETRLEEIAKTACYFDPDYKTFYIEVKRRYKEFFEQTHIKKHVGIYVAKNTNTKPVYTNPQLLIHIEIYDEKWSFVSFNKFEGVGGLPLGINNKCLSLISGGIDSPVSSFLMQKRGIGIDYLHFVTNNVPESSIEKIKNIIDTITLNKKLWNSKLYLIDYSEIEAELIHISNPKYRICLMRRSFYRIAKKIAILKNYSGLVSGDNLGQVASQTIESLSAIDNVLAGFSLYRPLITYEKNEIINIAKKINTYELSIQNSVDICALFAPKNPITKPKIETAIELENELKFLDDLENRSISKLKVII